MSRRRRKLEAANGTGHQRSRWGGFVDPILLHRVGEMVVNQTRTLQQQWGQVSDPRRDIEAECGYPAITESINPELYVQQWERNPIAARVVECLPKESWLTGYEVYETEDDRQTPFEIAVDSLPRQLTGTGGPSWLAGTGVEGNPVAQALEQVDILSGIGSYGGLLFGFDDVGKDRTLADPVEGFIEDNSRPSGDRPSEAESSGFTGNRYRLTCNAAEGSRRLLFLRAFAEPTIQITQYETNPTSPRYGFPVRYLVTLNDPRDRWAGIGAPSSTVSVHWTRILHVSDCHHQATSSPLFSPPRMRACLNDVLACHKILAADGEGFWRNSILKLFFETHPQLGGDVEIDRAGLRDEIENLMNGLQQWMATSGMSVKAIPPAVADPTPHLAAHVKAICIKLSIPVPVFEGYEIGEQASENNKVDWNRRLHSRRVGYLTPKVVGPFYSRLIAAGVLPKPKEFYVGWADVAEQDKTEQATVFASRMGAFSAAIAGGVAPNLMSEQDLLVREAGYTDEEAEAILENAARQQEEDMEEQQSAALEHGFAPAPPEGWERPEPEDPKDAQEAQEDEEADDKNPVANKHEKSATFDYRQAWLALNAAMGDEEDAN